MWSGGDCGLSESRVNGTSVERIEFVHTVSHSVYKYMCIISVPRHCFLELNHFLLSTVFLFSAQQQHKRKAGISAGLLSFPQVRMN